MGLHRNILVLLIFTTLAQSSKHKLFCKSRQQIVPPAPAKIIQPTPTPRPAIVRDDELIKGESDACCGSRAISTLTSTCCLGRPIKSSNRRCCISGPPVPWVAKCVCYPNSTWLQNEVERFKKIQSQTIDIMENVQNAHEQLLNIIDQKERLINELDSKASLLYESFLVEINMGRNEDAEEIQYIYEWITALHSSENNGFVKTLSEEELILIPGARMNDVPLNTLSVKEVSKVELLGLLRRLFQKLKKGIIQVDTLVETMKVAVKDSPLDSSLWHISFKKQETGKVDLEALENSEHQESKSSIESLVLERNRVLEQIRSENKYILLSTGRMEELDKILQQSQSEGKVVLQMVNILSLTIKEALELEDEIEALERETDEWEGGSFDSIKPSLLIDKSKLPGKAKSSAGSECNITNWIIFTSNLQTQIAESAEKMKEISIFIEGDAPANKIGSDPIPQWSSVSISTVEP